MSSFIVGYPFIAPSTWDTGQASGNINSTFYPASATPQTTLPVLPANYKLTELWAYLNVTTGRNTTIPIGVIDINGGTNTTKPRLHVETVPLTDANGTGWQWVKVTGLNIDFSAHVGKRLAAAMGRPADGTLVQFRYAAVPDAPFGGWYISSRGADYTLPDPFPSGGAAEFVSLYAVFEPIRSVIITGTTAFLDNFNRANGDIGSNYETMAAASGLPLTVFNNQLRGPTSTILSAMSSVSPLTTVFSPDQDAIIRYTAISNFDFAGPAVRINPINSTGYILGLDGVNNQGRRISRMDNGVITNLGAAVAIIPNVGDVFTLRAVGSLISAYRNGILVASASDSTYSTGQPGVYYKKENNNGTQMDNFIAVNVSTTGGSLAVMTTAGSRGLVIGTQ